jgi:3-mercaptopyruvate sulfurtransferase SseA
MLIDRGFKLVRPLAGGLDAWVAAGYAIEAEPLIAIRPPGSFDETSARPGPQ